MRESFFGLQQAPFLPAEETSSLLDIPVQRAALDALEELVAREVGVIVLEGSDGAGKSELLRRFQRRADPDRSLILLFARPDFDAAVLSKAIGELLVGPFKPLPDATQAVEMLLERRRLGQAAVLLVDRAERLKDAAWRALNAAAALGSPTEAALTIVLAGRPPLMAELGKPGRAVLRARAKGVVRLPGLAAPEACEFVRAGLRRAGADDPDGVLSPEAVHAIAIAAAGMPGRMITLTDAALRKGAAQRERPVSRHTVEQVARRSVLRDGFAAVKSRRWAGGMAVATCAAVAIGWGGLASGWWDKPVPVVTGAAAPARTPDPLAPEQAPKAATSVAQRFDPPAMQEPPVTDALDAFLLPARRGDTLRRLYRMAYKNQSARPSLDQFLAANPGVPPDRRLAADALIAFPGPLGPGWRQGDN